ncbi:hypothetical protein L1987_06642 [Smallanthus sonchifolius]|uniref:Uncharacterized protein n=1 Tax=Smallanthus sonchifolius TaxID=185202 RepID=A0ACB9JYN8_9ASTR|nr:hypothetical protein L1987_06642 [Smallanthus sonchifolius]
MISSALRFDVCLLPFQSHSSPYEPEKAQQKNQVKDSINVDEKVLSQYYIKYPWLLFYPFGIGSGSQLSVSRDSGMPEVVADPQGEVAEIFQKLGVCVVQQCAKIRQQGFYLECSIEAKDI